METSTMGVVDILVEGMQRRTLQKMRCTPGDLQLGEGEGGMGAVVGMGRLPHHMTMVLDTTIGGLIMGELGQFLLRREFSRSQIYDCAFVGRGYAAGSAGYSGY